MERRRRKHRNRESDLCCDIDSLCNFYRSVILSSSSPLCECERETVSNCTESRLKRRNNTKKAKISRRLDNLIIILVLLESITLVIILLGQLLIRIELSDVSRFLERRSSSCSWTWSGGGGDDRVVVVFILVVRDRLSLRSSLLLRNPESQSTISKIGAKNEREQPWEQLSASQRRPSSSRPAHLRCRQRDPS